MVGFLLGILLGMITTIVFLHYYGKRLDLKHKKQVGEIIHNHIQANEYAIS